VPAPVVPAHIGIIPDGNRRWAKGRGLPALEGHRQGVKVAKEIALASFERGVQYLTMYGFSAENWSRAQDEVSYLMDLYYQLLKYELKALFKRGVRFRFLGSRHGLPEKLLQVIDEAEARTAGNANGTLSLCLNYGGHEEVAAAVRSLLAEGVTPEGVTPEVIAQHLYAPELPPVDLIVRSSGEQRLSGFMLWRSTYAEFYFHNKHWPDFTVADLEAALTEYAQRQRRFGG